MRSGRTASPGAVVLVALAVLGTLTACPRPPVAPPPTGREPPTSGPSTTGAPSRPAEPSATTRPGAGAHEEPDVVGVFHVVRRGETLYRISRAYGIAVDDLLEVNGIKDAHSLEVGFPLFIPGAARQLDVAAATPGARESEPNVVATLPRPAGDRPGRLTWPLRGPDGGGRAGVIYSKFGPRDGQPHDGIDISAPEGTTVVAAAAGVVIFAGERSGYGSIVILRHAGEMHTLYAHASELLVKDGDRVAEGAPVARVGRSGKTTGPHLHFEVREGMRPRDPLPFLR